jgi:NAD(P)-dependent dehydrogenase (short-subunit alcohol dehydrogenase family)
MQLTDKRAIVTGAGGGIGAAAARAYLRDGAAVALLEIDEAACQRVVDDLRAEGHEVAYSGGCDVRDRAGVDHAFAAAVNALGGLDVLVHTAGMGSGGSAATITDEDWDRILDINAKGTLHTNQAAFRAMEAHGGSIINFGSMAGLRAMGAAGHYAASKGAVMAWTRVAAGEWGSYGIRVNAVAPSAITAMYERFRERLASDDLQRWDEELARLVPMGGRLGDPDLDIAPTLVFLGSDGSRFITGQVFSIDGGRVMLGS